MKLQKDDVRLLQYVLNEASTADRKIVELAVNTQPEIAAEIQDLKRLYADISRTELRPENLRLSAERKKILFEQTVYKQSSSSLAWLSKFKNWRYAIGGLVAATFALMVFKHSLKKEVTETARIERPIILADSAMTPPAANEKRSAVSSAPEMVKEHYLEAAKGSGGKVAKDSSESIAAGVPSSVAPAAPPHEALYDESAKEAPAAEISMNTEAPTTAISKELVAKKKSFISSKSGASVKALGGIVSRNEKELSYVKKGSVATDFTVLISSRALEAEQINSLQAKAKDCLQQFRVSQNLKIMFEVPSNKIEFTTVKPSVTEKQFAECMQKFMVTYLPKSIKLIHLELKAVSK